MIRNFERVIKLLEENIEDSYRTLDFLSDFEICYEDIDNVIIFGMGGSGVVGKIIERLYYESSNCPIISSTNRHIPSYLSSSTLAIFISYSGNTEETLNALIQASKKTDNIFCVTSNGDMMKFCEKNSIPYCEVYKGYPPRFSTVLMLLPVVKVLIDSNIIKEDMSNYQKGLDIVETKINDYIDEIREITATKKDLVEKPICFYSYFKYYPVAYKFKTDVNENAKLYAFSHEIPEMNHNEICSYYLGNKVVPVFIRFSDEPKEIRERIRVNYEILKEYSIEYIEVLFDSDVVGVIESCYYSILFSSKLAERIGVNPFEIEPIEKLKSKLKDKIKIRI